MSNVNIDTLNDVTKMLIDSQKGYEKAADVTEDDFSFRAEFQRRAADRRELVQEFQNRVNSLGGEAETDGGVLGSLHRAMTEFSSMFRDDTKAALEAIDDGEEQLAEHIERNLDNDGLDTDTRSLLQKAHQAAEAGECFADRLTD